MGCPRVDPTFKNFMCSKFMCLSLALFPRNYMTCIHVSFREFHKKLFRNYFLGKSHLDYTGNCFQNYFARFGWSVATLRGDHQWPRWPLKSFQTSWELRNIYHHHHPECKIRKSAEASSGSIHPYGRYGHAVKPSKAIPTIAILWPVKAIFSRWGPLRRM